MATIWSSNPVALPQLVETPFTRRLDSTVARYVRGHDVLRTGERVLLAVSGGPDSTALLLVLSRLRDELGIELAAAHFDHMLRSREEALGDRQFVEALTSALGLALATGGEDVRAFARRRKQSLEEAGRRLRYRFLLREANRFGASAVAVGHTLDDRAETVLLHVLRGSGLEGLVGMRPRAAWPFGRGPDVVRPLLGLRRRDAHRYCQESGVEPRLDPTNDLPVATRNRVRRDLVPVLRGFNPRIEEALVRLGENVEGDVQLIESLAAVVWERSVEVEKKDEVRIARATLDPPSPSLIARLLRRVLERLGGGRRAEVEAQHVEAIAQALRRSRSRVALPGGLEAVVEPRWLRITRRRAVPARRIAQTPLTVPGSTTFDGWTLSASVEDASTIDPVTRDPGEVYIDADRVRGALSVRSRRPGDRMRPLGLGGSKKVQDIMVDRGIPQEERSRVPVVVDEEGIVWLCGLCIDERVAMGPASKRVLHLQSREKGKGSAP
jgi:tRNA(Ile)-lysidine synthase